MLLEIISLIQNRLVGAHEQRQRMPDTGAQEHTEQARQVEA